MGAQVSGLAPLHVPPTQVSDCVHAFPSLQDLPSAVAVCVHPVPGAHPSSVQTWPSSHVSVPAPATQVVPAHVSPTVHGSPSMQVPPVAVCVQPADLSHASTVQALASSHDPIFPAHTALAQLSFEVQASPSSQAALLGLWTQP